MNSIIVRPAHSKDSPEIAQLMITAAGGIMEFLFDDLLEEVSTEQIVTSAVETEQGNLSYRNSVVVEINGQVIAIANSYSASNH